MHTHCSDALLIYVYDYAGDMQEFRVQQVHARPVAVTNYCFSRSSV